jgi:hypothetical protein
MVENSGSFVQIYDSTDSFVLTLRENDRVDWSKRLPGEENSCRWQMISSPIASYFYFYHVSSNRYLKVSDQSQTMDYLVLTQVDPRKEFVVDHGLFLFQFRDQMYLQTYSNNGMILGKLKSDTILATSKMIDANEDTKWETVKIHVLYQPSPATNAPNPSQGGPKLPSSILQTNPPPPSTGLSNGAVATVTLFAVFAFVILCTFAYFAYRTSQMKKMQFYDYSYYDPNMYPPTDNNMDPNYNPNINPNA